MKRQHGLVGCRNILRGASQSENLRMQLHDPFGFRFRHDGGLVVEHQDFRAKKRAFLIDLEHLKTTPAFGNNIQPTVIVFLHDADNLSRTPDVREALFHGPHHTKTAVQCSTFGNHFLIAWLENVQGKGSAWKEHHIEREKGKKIQAFSQEGTAGLRHCNPVRDRRLAGLTLRLAQAYKASMQLLGKVVVVTGASMGIGEAIAKTFAAEGASVVLLSRDMGRVEAARSRVGHAEQTLALSCDVRNPEEIDRAIGLAMHHFHRIDVWVNNAGHGLMDSVAQMDMAACRELFETNLFGAVDAMKAVIPIMRQQNGGTIINISSVAGHIPLPFHAAYSATKFALNAMGKAAGVELKKDRIHVLTVCPGYVRTNFGKNAVRGNQVKTVRPASVRGISAERVAWATLRGYLKGKREVVVPWPMRIPIKLYQLFPWLVEWSMGKMAG